MCSICLLLFYWGKLDMIPVLLHLLTERTGVLRHLRETRRHFCEDLFWVQQWWMVIQLTILMGHEILGYHKNVADFYPPGAKIYPLCWPTF